MSRKCARALAALLLFASPVCAGPRKFFKAYGHQLKASFTDMKRHPFAWGIYALGTVAINFADAGTTCYGRAKGYVEAGAPIYGRRPSCHKIVLGTAAETFLFELPAVHYISDWWTAKCYDEAADPASRWSHIDAATHNPESCRWNVPAAGTADWAYHLEVIHANVQLWERKKR